MVTVDDMVRALAKSGSCAPCGQQDLERGQLALLTVTQRLGAVSRSVERWYRRGTIKGLPLPGDAAALAVAALAAAVNIIGADRLEALLQKEIEGGRGDDDV